MNNESGNLPSVPSVASKALAIEANQSFTPPLHVQADVYEAEMVGILAECIEHGLLVRGSDSKFFVPEHRATEWSALPVIAAIAATNIK